MKVTIVGAGAVGASCAEYIAIKDFASEVVLVDIKEGYAEGKALKRSSTQRLPACHNRNGFFDANTENGRRQGYPHGPRCLGVTSCRAHLSSRA